MSQNYDESELHEMKRSFSQMTYLGTANYLVNFLKHDVKKKNYQKKSGSIKLKIVCGK